MDYLKTILLFLLSVLTFASSSVNGETDEEYWRRREQEAQIIARASYVPDPFSVTNSFNAAVNRQVTYLQILHVLDFRVPMQCICLPVSVWQEFSAIKDVEI